jgi:tRNA pseudouridine38-40 synthase
VDTPIESEDSDAQRPAEAPRWKCLCAYDGRYFAGWQSQPGGIAIQDVLEARLGAVLGRALRIHASGRTDAGVHALGQVFHFDAEWRHGPEKLKAAFRSGLPEGLQIQRITAAKPDFHARFSATGKIYTYNLFLGDADPFTRPYVWTIEKPLDVAAMAAAAKVLEGKHDFRAFSALNGPPKEDTVRDLRRLTFVRHGARVRITAEADGFMYKMVRSLVGALYAVGESKLTPEQLRDLLESGKRIPAIQTAPPQGLFLTKVLY